MELVVHSCLLPLSAPFRIVHESRTEQPSLIVVLRDSLSGVCGYGEAPMTRYYGLEATACAIILHNLAPAFAPYSTLTPAELHSLIDREAPDLHPFLRCALDVATHDLWARQQCKRLGSLWQQPAKQTPTCYTIGMGSQEEMISRLTAFPWPIYKIKLGGQDDLALIRALRQHTTAPFYVDANTGWSAQQTIDYSHELQALGVVFIEQPLPPDDLLGQFEVFGHSALPVIADESCQAVADIDRCAGLFHGVNIKIVKCGGLLPARQMIARARQLGLSVMAGCMTESSVGISAIAQLLPELDFADLDGAMLLATDPADGVTFSARTGFARYPDEGGTGVTFFPERLH